MKSKLGETLKKANVYYPSNAEYMPKISVGIEIAIHSNSIYSSQGLV